MKAMTKRILSVLLAAVMVVCLLPVGLVGASDSDVRVLTQEDYALVDALFDRIEEMENAPAKKNSTEAQLADAAEALVLASDNYVEGSLERNGNYFSWMTDEGIRCCYSPRMREIEKEMTPPVNPQPDGAYNEPIATKGGWPSSNQVYLVAPYYGYDDSFTDQYKNEATSIASAIGDSDGYTLYSGKAATVDKVAEAVSNGAVVIFDSHGNTDYENGYDYVTGANYSYLCLKSTDGLTDADYDDGAVYYSDGIWINGATIANHMTKNSPSGLLWMAICLGMATDSFATPMREMGVEVVYGYSQSVTFAGDYLYEETFWDNMIAGKDVATSIAAMKTQWGDWDWSVPIASYYGYTSGSDAGYSTISAARADYAAFPIVVSDEDTHPGQRNGTSNYGADSLQTVRSTYTLYSQYEVTAQSNNNTYGTVTVNGSTITATPATGYFAQGYTVLSGTATVSQTGNTFSVVAQSDCTVQINFAAKTPVTVSFSGASVASQNGYAGDAMTLPTAEAPEGYKFLGWTTSPLADKTTVKPDFYKDSYTPTGNTTLYALYSYVDADSGTGTGDYVKVTESRDDWSGEYLIVYEDGGVVFDSSLATLDDVSNYAAVTITDSTISAAEGDLYKFTVSAVDGGYAIQALNGQYIGGKSGSNTLTTSADPLVNTFSLTAEGDADIVSNTSHLRYNATSGQDRFRYYKSSSYADQKAIALYLKDGSAGTTYYISTLCDHSAGTTNVAAKDATCTEDGYTAGVQCDDCGAFISGHEVIEATGHSYNAVVTNPTATTQGYTTYTCTACGDSYVSNYVDALGEEYTVSFSVPSGVAAIAPMTGNNAGITLPTAGVPTGDQEYTFLGWVVDEYNNVTDKPADSLIYKAGSKYVATGDITLRALYSYGASGEGGEGGFVLTDIADITEDDVVVVTMTYGDTVYALTSGNGASKAPVATIVTDWDSIAENIKWNIGGTAGNYIFYPNGDTSTWLYCTSANNGVRVGTNEANTFSIDGSSGYLKHNGTGRYLGVYRTTPDWRCYTNTTGNTVDQTLGFYVQSTGGATTTYYTTTTCDHSVGTTTVAGQDATCTEDGYTAGQQCNGCGVFVSGHEVIEATGHSYTGVVTNPTAGEQGYTTYTCSGCGDSYTDDYTDALGYDYTVTFQVPDGVAAIGDMISNSKTGIILPSAGVPTGDKDYEFLGWVVAAVDNSTDAPTYYAAGSKYTASENITLIALYRYSVGGGSSSTTTTYTVSDYPAGTQYAEGEEHVLDSNLTVVTTQSHWTSELRLYSSSTHDGYAIFKANAAINGLTVSVGNNSDTLNVYGSNDGGETWELIEGLSVSSAYTDLSVDFDGASYKWLKLDVAGANQLRIKYFTVSYASTGTTYYTTVISSSTEPDEPDVPEENFTLSFGVPAGFAGMAPVVGNGTVKLPEEPQLRDHTQVNGITTYEFLGWVTDEYDNVTEKPSVILPAGSNFALYADETLYALFTYSVTEGGGEGSTTKYTFSSFAAGTQYAQGEEHNLDENVTLVINGAHLNSQIRLYAGSNAVFELSGPATGSLVLKAGYKVGTLTIYGSTDGSNWTSIKAISTTTTYTEYTVALPAGTAYTYLKMESTGAQIRVSEAQITLAGTSSTTTYYTTMDGHDAEETPFALLVGSHVSLGNVLDMHFYVDATDNYFDGNLTITLSYVSLQGEKFENAVVVNSGYSISANAYRVLSIGLPAAYMATSVTATLSYNSEKMDTVTYSIRSYASTIIANANGLYTDEQISAAKAMLNYGAWAQNYFGYNTGDLANNVLDAGDQLTDTAAALSQVENIAQYKATVTNKLDGFIGYTLLLKDVTGLRLYFSEQVTVMVDGVAKVAEVDSQNNSRYYVEIEGVNADELDTTIEITCGEMEISNLSVLSPAAIVAQNTGKSENFRNAMIALILYAQSVNDMLTEG